MKKSIILGLTIVSLTLISSATAVPLSESKPIVKMMNQLECLKEEINTFIAVDFIYELVSKIIGYMFLISSLFFVFLGYLCIFDIGGTFAPAGLVFILIGLFSGIISFILLSLG